VADPLTAAITALRTLGAGSVGIVSPYVASVADPLAGAFEAAGIAVAGTLSFGEAEEARVARIDPRSVREAALEVGRVPGIEALFISCTNLRTLDIVADLEATTGIPVLSSNLVLAWHMFAQAGLAPPASLPSARLSAACR
jgi:maleate isomerase